MAPQPNVGAGLPALRKYYMQVPVLMIEAETLPEAWENAVVAAWQKGLSIKTEYDKADDPPSKDCTMVMVIKNPMAEPRIHRAFPAGLEDLEVYRQEVVLGVHDHWIKPQEGKWTYTYHKRLFQFETGDRVIDQIDYIINKLSVAPHSRRAQAITWQPCVDSFTDEPPCLQRLWCRITQRQEDGLLELNMNSHWRSRDAYKAAFMNIFALTDLQRVIAENISEKIKRPVALGRYVDISDSFHIYGSYYSEFKNFLNIVNKRSFKDRTWNSDFAQPFFTEARKRLKEEAKAGQC